MVSTWWMIVVMFATAGPPDDAVRSWGKFRSLSACEVIATAITADYPGATIQCVRAGEI